MKPSLKICAVLAFCAATVLIPRSAFAQSVPTAIHALAVQAAQSRTKDGMVKMSGTSMAAPAVTGLVALMLAKARKEGKSLGIADIRAKLKAGVKPGAGPAGWDPQRGDGRAGSGAI